MTSRAPDEKHKKRFLHFMNEFLCPLVLGGDLHIGLPINQEELSYFLIGSAPDETRVMLSEVEEVREARCAEWTRIPQNLVPLPEDKATVCLAAAVYNLLFLSHPVVERWSVTNGALKDLMGFTLKLIERVPVARTPREALAYHSVLAGLSSLYRTDIEVRWWVGKRDFLGTQPPRRLLLWRKVRRVTQETTKTPWLSIPLSEHQVAIWKAILWRSPLTELSLTTRQTPLRLSPGLLALSDPDIWRGICAVLLSRGFLLSAGELVKAFWQAAALPPLSSVPATSPLPPPQPAEVLRCAAQFFYHLVSLGLFLEGQECFDKLAGEAENQGGESAREIASTYAVLYQFDKLYRELSIPPDLLGAGEGRLDQLIKKTIGLGSRFLERSEEHRRLGHLKTVFSLSREIQPAAQSESLALRR